MNDRFVQALDIQPHVTDSPHESRGGNLVPARLRIGVGQATESRDTRRFDC